MRVACVCSPKGSHYRFYRTSRDLKPDLTQLVSILLEKRFNARIGGMDDDPDVVLTVGPLDSSLSFEFRCHVMAYLGVEPLCVTDGPNQ